MKRHKPIRQFAHGRAGDKGDILNISVISKHPKHFDHLVMHVTEAHCKAVFAKWGPSEVKRYELPNLAALNFVLRGVLDGGVNQSLHVDRHGKTLSSVLFDSLIPEPVAIQV